MNKKYENCVFVSKTGEMIKTLYIKESCIGISRSSLRNNRIINEPYLKYVSSYLRHFGHLISNMYISKESDIVYVDIKVFKVVLKHETFKKDIIKTMKQYKKFKRCGEGNA